MARLRLFLLGGFSVSLDDQTVTGFESDKVRALLAYLALKVDQPQRRETLAALLWPEHSEERARHNLRQALFNLRIIIGDHHFKPPFLTITPQTIQLNSSSNIWSDFTAFTHAIEANLEHQHGQSTFCGPCLEWLGEAARLYRGRFLNGFTLKGCQEFNEWIMVEAQRQHNQVLGVLRRLVFIHQGLGNTEQMLAYATQWVTLEPYDEAAHRAVMLALAFTGQREAAINQYETCRDLFMDELGVQLDAQTQDLHKYLMVGEVPDDYAFDRMIQAGVSKPIGECPYRGLAAFKEEDALFFFGREAFVGQLQERLQGHPPITNILGPSGSGKSSVVYAGLLPRLREEDGLLIAEMRPGSDPFQALSVSFQSVHVPDPYDLDSTIEPQESGDTRFGDLCDQICKMGEGSKRVLLIVDQFEELFTICLDLETRQRFLSELLRTVECRSKDGSRRCLVLMTLRADFMGQVLSYRPFADALQDACLLMGPMSREELQAAIEKPAEIQGVGFESGLVTRLLDDVGDEPGNLPLLEFALTLLWERGENGILTHTAYEKIGRVKGALASYADEVYENLTDEEQEKSRLIFLQLVQPGDGTEDTRRVGYKDELGEDNWSLVQYLATQRLVVTGCDQAGRDYVEVAHEALIQSWGRFQEWMRVDRAFRTWQEGLRWSMRQWEQSDHSEGALLRGTPLVEAEGWLYERSHGLNQAERNYIQTSAELQQRRQAKRDRRRKWVFSAMGFGLFFAILLVLFIWQQRQEARRQASIGLASQAVSEIQGAYPERAVLLALEALEHYPYTWQAEHALGRAVLDSRLRLILTHDDYVNTAEWSADERKILTGSSDGTVRLWDTTSGEELLTITDGAPTMASWSPDGKSILTVNPKDVILKVWDIENEMERLTLSKGDIGGELNINLEQWAPWSPLGDRFLTYSIDGRVKIWDVETGMLLETLLVNPGQADQTSVAPEDLDKLVHYFYFEEGDKTLWSPNGDKIAVSSNAHNRITVWSADTGERLYVIPGDFEDERVFIGSWSPSGDRFVIRGLGGIKVYDSINGTLLLNINTPETFIYRAIWSPDGSLLLTSGIDDGTARVWDAESGKELMQIANLVVASGSDWFGNGDVVAVGGNDGLIHIWDADKGQEIQKLSGTQPRINTVAFSPSGDRLLAVGDENVVNVYELSEAILALGFDTDPTGMISNAAWSPDGDQIVIGIGDFTARVWNATSGEDQVILDGHESVVWVVAWSPSGNQLLTASGDHTVIVWDTNTWEQQLVFTGHEDEVIFVDWSPDGNCIASTDISSGKVILWDPNTGEEILTFYGHQGFVLGSIWSPDGERILSFGSQGEAMIWESATGKVIHNLFPDDFQLDIIAATWSLDGEQVFVQSADGIFYVFEISTGSERYQFDMPRASLSYFSLSPNEERILKGGDGSAKVWDLKNGAELLSYDTPGWVDASYSPDGTKISIGSNQGTLEIYPTWHSTQELIDYAKDCCLVRELTPEERDLYGLLPGRE